MVVLGLPLALPVFVLSFFLCFIPYIGGFISTGIAFLITIAVGSPADIVIMAIWTIVFNLVTGNIVSPIVYGRTVHIHPAIVLVAIPAGAAIAGVLGMFVVVPAIGVVAATWRTVLWLMGTRGLGAQGRNPPQPYPRRPRPSRHDARLSQPALVRAGPSGTRPPSLRQGYGSRTLPSGSRATARSVGNIDRSPPSHCVLWPAPDCPPRA